MILHHRHRTNSLQLQLSSAALQKWGLQKQEVLTEHILTVTVLELAQEKEKVQEKEKEKAQEHVFEVSVVEHFWEELLMKVEKMTMRVKLEAVSVY